MAQPPLWRHPLEMQPPHAKPDTGQWREAALAGRGWQDALGASARLIGARAAAIGIECGEASQSSGRPEWCGDPSLFAHWSTICASSDDTGGVAATDAELIYWARADASAQTRVWVIVVVPHLIDRSILRELAEAAADAAFIRHHLARTEQRGALANEALEALGIGAALVSPDWEVESANRACLRMLARGDGLILDRGRLSCTHERDRPHLLQAHREAQQGKPRRAFVRLGRRTKDGASLVWFAPAHGAQSACLLVVIDSDAAGQAGDPWRSMFDLSETEMQLAQSLIATRVH